MKETGDIYKQRSCSLFVDRASCFNVVVEEYY